MSRISSEPDKSVALVKMIPIIYGKPCVCATSRGGSVFVSKKIFGVRIEWGSIGQSINYQVLAENAWVDPPRTRPDSLTEGLAIGHDCLEVGPNWWFDTYFRWYFVFDPEMVAQSLAGDHSWMPTFLNSVSQPKAEPGAAPDPAT